MKQTRRPDNCPSFQFYPDDWLAEKGLRLCDLAARGLWIDLLCFMFRGEKRGVIEVKGGLTLLETVSRIAGIEQSKAEAALEQLIAFGVAEVTETTIYSRRMVGDEKKRRSKVEAGRKGGFTKEANKRLADTLAEPVAKARSSSPTPSSSPSPTPKEETSKSDESPIFGDTGEGDPPSREEAAKVSIALRKAALGATGGKGKLQPIFHDTDRIMVLLSRSNYTPEDLLAMVAFARGDPFWRAHILSGGDLEKHADTLYAKMQAEGAGNEAAWEKARLELIASGEIDEAGNPL